MAGATGLEPATSGVTGRRSNQLSYAPATSNAETSYLGSVGVSSNSPAVSLLLLQRRRRRSQARRSQSLQSNLRSAVQRCCSWDIYIQQRLESARDPGIHVFASGRA